MKTSTEDKIEGTVRQATGVIQEKTGAAVKDPRMESEGLAEKVAGKVQSKVGDVKKAFGR
jgi:uncharacterized protein YjbJ (UPF0337 family)